LTAAVAQRVLVTAAASGIGRAIAEAFLDVGARVCICDLDPAALARALQDDARLFGVRADISRPEDVNDLVSAADQSMGGIDVLVNNAGIAGPTASMHDVPYAEWRQTFDVNVHGAFLMLQRVIPQMRRRRSGCVVNISTTSTRTGLPGRTAYVASKWALEGLTLNLARELGPDNIRVNAVRPGFMDTPRMREIIRRTAAERRVTIEAAEQELLGFISMRTKITPREVGEMCVFLASAAARHVTGQIVAVDGNAEWEG
jgi:NAD(P)-dependent dehydrogenase (short-subunit alcohol dehydrogenase family)